MGAQRKQNGGPAHLVFSLDDNDGHGGCRPAVLSRERLVTVPQHNDLRQERDRERQRELVRKEVTWRQKRQLRL